MNRIKTWLSHPTHFTGVLVGVALVFSSLLFLWSGRPLALNESLNNIYLALIIIGGFAGIRIFRDRNHGTISFSHALLTGFRILGISTTIYIVYYAILYLSRPDLVEAFKQLMLIQGKELLGDLALYRVAEEQVLTYITPLFIIFVEWFQKIFYGALFMLILALLLRRNHLPAKQEE